MSADTRRMPSRSTCALHAVDDRVGLVRGGREPRLFGLVAQPLVIATKLRQLVLNPLRQAPLALVEL
jgi:hypothetical protein